MGCKGIRFQARVMSLLRRNVVEDDDDDDDQYADDVARTCSVSSADSAASALSSSSFAIDHQPCSSNSSNALNPLLPTTKSLLLSNNIANSTSLAAEQRSCVIDITAASTSAAISDINNNNNSDANAVEWNNRNNSTNNNNHQQCRVRAASLTDVFGGRGLSSRRNSSPNYRRRVLLNHVLLIEAAHERGQNEAYEELKRLIIFAGIFFLFMIVFVLLKFQVSLDDVFKWSPVVWLVGVIVCGLLMNAFLQLKKFVKRRRVKRLREQQNLLYSLNLPDSFPCLAPPPHTENCCRCGHTAAAQIDTTTSTDEFDAEEEGAATSLWTVHPHSQRRGGHQQRSCGSLPTYEQVMERNGATKTWRIIPLPLPPPPAAAEAATPVTAQPPTYSTLNLTSDASGANATALPRQQLSPPRMVVIPAPPLASSATVVQAEQPVDVPPPAYDDLTLNIESV